MKTKKKNSSRETVAGIDLHEIERLLEFMAQHGLEEFEYHSGEVHVRLKKPLFQTNAAPGPRPLPAAETAARGMNPAPAAEGAAAEPAAAAPEAPPAEDLHVIKSPIVGTYYEAPTPGAEPFVRVGSQVEAGKVLCIIEAMKLMNEIESDVAGEVVRIHAENGQPVEYGEPLFSLRPARKK